MTRTQPRVTADQLRALVPEEAFLQHVISLARHLGWRTVHFRPGLTKRGTWKTAVAGDGKGFVDLVLCRERVIYAELKSEKGRLSPEQAAWIEALRAAGQEVYVWRPSSWSEVGRVLGA